MIRGEDAESRFLAYTRREGGVNSRPERGGGRYGGNPSFNQEGGSPFVPLGRDEFHLLRVESDNFVNRVPSSPLEETAVLERGDKGIPRIGGDSGHGGGEGSACTPPSWDGSLPPRAVLVADGFLVPGKADGGVYVVIPSLSEEGGGDGEDLQYGERRWEQDYTEGRVVRLTKIKRSDGVHQASRCSATSFPKGLCVYVSFAGGEGPWEKRQHIFMSPAQFSLSSGT